ncbi:MAG: O-antigen ligase family protein [Coriobacteriia bacterium]|nr:O-antigen ligase family protein [Coriobacteriia bacterium]
MATLLCALVVGRYLFSSVCIIFGFDYVGSENSRIYTYLMAFLAVFGCLFFVYQLTAGRKKISHFALIGLTAMLALTLYLYVGKGAYEDIYDLLSLFVVFALPAFLVGICVDNHGAVGLDKILKVLYVLMPLFTLAVALYQLLNASSGWTTRAFADVSYQMVSYIAAFSFGINVILLSDKKNDLPDFVHTKFFRVIQDVLLLVQAACVLVSGGRGGVVLLAIYVIWGTLRLSKGKGSVFRFFAFLLIAIMAVFGVSAFVDWTSSSQLAGVQRLLSLRDNRSELYSQAFLLIENKPLLGYGPGGYYSYLDVYCHNLLLDLLLSFGLLGTSFIALFFGAPIVATIKRIKDEAYYPLLVLLFLFMFCHLFFSSTFLVDPILWFLAGVFLNGMQDSGLDMKEVG